MPEDHGGRGLGALLKDLVEGSGELVRQEVRLARVEATGLARAVGVGTGAVPTFDPQEAPSRRPGSNRSQGKAAIQTASAIPIPNRHRP